MFILFHFNIFHFLPPPDNDFTKPPRMANTSSFGIPSGVSGALDAVIVGTVKRNPWPQQIHGPIVEVLNAESPKRTFSK